MRITDVHIVLMSEFDAAISCTTGNSSLNLAALYDQKRQIDYQSKFRIVESIFSSSTNPLDFTARQVNYTQ